MSDVAVTGDRVRTYAACGVQANLLGTIVSGPSDGRLFRIELDKLNEHGNRFVYLFENEFEVIGNQVVRA